MKTGWILPIVSAVCVFAQAPATTEMPPLPPGVTVERNLAYSTYPETKLDVLKPSGWNSRGKYCGVIAIHGGGWVNGTKEASVNSLVLPWLTQGCVVANVEYRLAKAAVAPAAVEDVLKAAQFVRRNADKWRIDDDRMIVTGGSAGGHLALMVGLAPKSAKLGPAANVAAVVNFYGITDVEDQIDGPNMRKYAATWVPPSPDRSDIARKVSPIEYVRKEAPAVLTIHGTADPTVPYEHGVRLTKALRDAGADAELISVPEGKHGFPKEQLDKLYEQIFEFARRRNLIGVQK
jgi:acetyl esterase/lipase